MTRFARREGLAIAGLASLIACDQLFDIQERQPIEEAGVDSSVAESGADASVDASREAGEADTSTDASSCPTLYVSTSTGSDTNTGCATGTPKKTIAAAIAKTATSTVTTIEVCAGTYLEVPLVLDTATSLEGGFNCTTWKRGAGYGYPTFSSVNATIIENNAPSTAGATLHVTGSTIAASVLVDGFAISGATSGNTASAASAILCDTGASPTVSNNKLTGGSNTASAGLASVGVYVLTGANPTIVSNTIDGGSGTIAPLSSYNGHASVGIMTDGTSAAVQILGNTIGGGSGNASNTAADGSVAVELLGAAATADAGTSGPTYTVQGNMLAGGTGMSTGGAATTGLSATGIMTLIVDSNGIDGGTATSGAHCSSGVFSQTTGKSTFTGNRIYGGNCGVTSATFAPLGLKVQGAGSSPTIYNNMIHAGIATNALAGGAVGTVGSSAIVLQGVTGADVRHNTLVGGTTMGTPAEVLWLSAGTSSTTVANNILAGSGTNAGLVITPCADAGPPALQSFENNVVFGTSVGLLKWYACFGDAAYPTVDAMSAELRATQAGATVQDNLTLASTCTTDAGTDSGCIVSAGCTSPATCLTTFFSGWDAASDGYKNLMLLGTLFAGSCGESDAGAGVDAGAGALPPAGNGWTIAARQPCAVTQSSLDDHTLNALLGIDLYGNCRSSTPSMGAEEDSTAKCL